MIADKINSMDSLLPAGPEMLMPSSGKMQSEKYLFRRLPMKEDIKRILVVSWMTKYCQKAVHYGISEARKHGAELFIIHVIHNPFGLEGFNVPVVSLEQDYKNLFKDAKKDLDKIIQLERGTGLPITEFIKEGNPTEEILKIVKEEKIDLLISLHYQEWRFEHFLFCGSIKELIRTMPCSIMLVKNELKPGDW
jgi:nucleotide-binding universal stress UspA family protein